MKYEFLMLLWKSFEKALGIPGLLLSFILSFIFWKWLPNATIQLYWFVLFLIITFLTITTLIHALYETFVSKSILPKVITSLEQNKKLIILLKPSELFSIGTIVSFYHKDENNYEKIIGLGSVLNIQDNDKIIQVELSKPLLGKQGLITKIKRKNKDVLQKLLIKPYVPKDYFEETYVQK